MLRQDLHKRGNKQAQDTTIRQGYCNCSTKRVRSKSYLQHLLQTHPAFVNLASPLSTSPSIRQTIGRAGSFQIIASQLLVHQLAKALELSKSHIRERQIKAIDRQVPVSKHNGYEITRELDGQLNILARKGRGRDEGWDHIAHQERLGRRVR
jgi:hypothetical protein